ncbi:inorganic phosphate transporter [Lichenifustis flavocetrariae]|uniref:Phosphate transporter n=1 Tax=Lichenifustis flavocetrariae TaxID=2949735 RepID=A0AA42CLL1_9HYPH|nr:inorganic phosphate transporter [Lichenifustis flavocetrariae]MCW6507487.1 inorganic phosphate transporter [Lichenifustis flavocetrariae]
MLAFLAPGSPATLSFLVVCLVLALAFEFSNGFHDTANAVATVIYTHSLKPIPAVIWSGLMNFLGVILGGIAVAYALVELIPADVLSPPNGGIAVGMLAALFLTALFWNIGTWWLGLPNSSSHALIGALVGISVENALTHGRGLHEGVDWHQIWSVLASLLVSPILGFAGALLLFQLIKHLLHDKALFEPPKEDKPPVWWMRGILILTCTGVSFAHGTNDGQKSIGLIMLTIIGLLPATYALNTTMTTEQVAHDGQAMATAAGLIGRYGDDQKELGVTAAQHIGQVFGQTKQASDIPDRERPAIRNDLNRVMSELKTVEEAKGISEDDKKQAKSIHEDLMHSVQYAPWWVRVLSALCLGAGTMIGYKRIVTTLGERLGNQHLAPAQGAAAELVAATLIGGAGLSGFPVSTTHVVTGGITGTMVGSGAGIQRTTLWQIGAAWVLTLPATVALSAGLFYILS